MDTEPHSRIWSRISNLFSSKSEDNLANAIMEASAEGDLDEAEGSMILSILTLDEVMVQDLMVPRTDIDCLAKGTNLYDAAISITESGHSRLPVYEDTRDNIIGIVYAKDMLKLLIQPNGNQQAVESIMREPFFIPETKIASELLQEFRSMKNHMAIVVDEYGGTSGLVTIEDLLEVIVGDIEDEHDAPRPEEIRKISDHEYELSGRTYLEDLEEIGIRLDSEEVDTIGGYLSLEAGHLPQTGECFTIEGWNFEVAEADAKQIHKVVIKQAAELEESD